LAAARRVCAIVDVEANSASFADGAATMDTITSAATPLRQRMLENMRMRKLEPRTQEAYVRAVRKLAAYLHRSPDTATVEDLRNFQLHLVDTGTSPMTLNVTPTGLRFFFDVTLERVDCSTQHA
jgi:integrase/recombinase XerD